MLKNRHPSMLVFIFIMSQIVSKLKFHSALLVNAILRQVTRWHIALGRNLKCLEAHATE